MSYNSKHSHSLTKKSRQSDRTQLDRIRRSYPEQAMGDEDWIEESERYLDNVKAMESKFRKWTQLRGMGEEAEKPEG